jgi:hypothetical protein
LGLKCNPIQFRIKYSGTCPEYFIFIDIFDIILI